MKRLTQEYVKSVLDYDQKSGDFHWRYRPDRRKCWNNRLAGKRTGCVGWAGKNKAKYILLRIDDILYKAHTIAWLWVHGEWIGHLDHKDMDGTNNKISNLRKASRSQNQCNRKIQSNNTSGYKGVSFSKSLHKWCAYIKFNKKRKYLGSYECAIEAHKAYCSAAKKIHSDFARFK